ncbi:MAG TPA: hypothetical protein VNK48_14375 [Xanthobacteraceae bacterium]|nr:hypothetical protein [Xanthobacteraceae bacterium]
MPEVQEVEIEIKTKVRLSIELAAQWFASLDDDAQARFFVAVCEAAERWPRDKGVNFGPAHQWWLVGRHLKDCECSSEAARDMVRQMYDGLQDTPQGGPP